MYSIVNKICKNGKTMGFTLLRTDNKSKFFVNEIDAKILASRGLIAGVQYNSIRDEIKAITGARRLRDIPVTLYRDRMIFTDITKGITLRKGREKDVEVHGILFSKFNMQPCGVIVSIQGRINKLHLSQYKELIDKGITKGIKVIDNKELDKYKSVDRLLIDRNMYGGILFKYIKVFNCLKNKWTIDEANVIFPNSNEIIDYLPSSNINVQDSELFNKELSSNSDIIEIPMGSSVHIVGKILRMNNYGVVDKSNKCIVSYKGKIAVIKCDRLSTMKLNFRDYSNGIVWIENDTEAQVDVQGDKYIIRK